MEGFALGMRYLTGYSVATDPASRDAAEWPPHPGRVFMALAAAHFETGEDPSERAALEWLESLHPPALSVSDADHRSVVTSFVPVNDRAGPSKAPLQSAPGVTRDRKPRVFPTTRPHNDTVLLIWKDVAVPPEHRDALDGLCRKVIRIGHSSSFVQMWYTESLEGLHPSLVVAHDVPEMSLRRVGTGTLDYLRRQYNAEAIETFARLAHAVTTSTGEEQREAKAAFERTTGQKWKRNLDPPKSQRPILGAWQGYRWSLEQDGEAPVHTVFDPSLFILRLEPKRSRFRRLDLATTLQLTDVLRRGVQEVVVNHLKAPIPAVLSGHGPERRPLETPHAAYLPLAFVGREHATGHLMGLAVAFPRIEHWPAHQAERRIALGALARMTELTLGRLGVWGLVPEVRETPPDTLRPENWTAAPRGARVWTSVTPIAFDEHPKTKNRSAYLEAVAGMLGEACVRVGLPEPVAVYPTPVSRHLGAPPAREFPRFRRKDGSERRHTHAVLEFERPVVGPVVLGAGRYRGYGLCRPVRGLGA